VDTAITILLDGLVFSSYLFIVSRRTCSSSRSG